MKLEDIAILRTGITLRQKVRPDKKGDAYLVQMRDIVDNFRGLELSIKIDGSKFSTKHVLQPKDILFVAKGQHNKAILYQGNYQKAFVASMFIVIRPNPKKILAEYLVWYLNEYNAQRQLERYKEGTATTSIGIGSLRLLEIKVPPLEEQKKIIQLIELMDREAELLEQIKEKRTTIITTLIKQKISNHD